jgi:mono/diheme cytochrome c family protein
MIARSNLFAVTVAVGMSLPAVALAGEGDAEAGRKLAAEHCTRCHVVGDINPHGGIDSTPKFVRLAKFEDYDARFQTFYARRPHPLFVQVEGGEPLAPTAYGAVPFTITDRQIDDLMAYVEQLRAAE